MVCGRLVGRPGRWPTAAAHYYAGAGCALPQGRRPRRRARGSLPAPVRAAQHGQDRQGRRGAVPLSRAGVQLVRRLRAQPARHQEHSAAREGAQLSGDRKAQGDLDLDGRPAGRRVQGPGLQRARQCSRTAHHQARQHRHQGELRADHRQPARPQPHQLSARGHPRQRRHGGIRHPGRAGERGHRRQPLRHQRDRARHVRAVLAVRARAGRQVHPHALDAAEHHEPDDRHLLDRRGARERHRLSRHPSAHARRATRPRTTSSRRCAST